MGPLFDLLCYPRLEPTWLTVSAFLTRGVSSIKAAPSLDDSLLQSVVTIADACIFFTFIVRGCNRNPEKAAYIQFG